MLQILQQPVVRIALQSTCIYLFIVIAFRLFGKKELAQLNVIDLVFILLISNSVQNAMVGQISEFYGGVAAALALFGVNSLFKWALKTFPKFSKVVQGETFMLIYKGKIQKANFEKSMLTMEELKAAVREHGVETIDKVDLAILEIDGNISVMSKDYQHKTIRKRRAHKAVQKNN